MTGNNISYPPPGTPRREVHEYQMVEPDCLQKLHLNGQIRDRVTGKGRLANMPGPSNRKS
jgi:hypothetical protein